MNSTKISLWCADHLDAWVEMYFTDIGIEIEMQCNLGRVLKHVIPYLELRTSKFDLMGTILDDMYKKIKSVEV